MNDPDSPLRPDEIQPLYETLKSEIQKVIVGQDDIIELLLVSLFSRGHCLLIGVPGLAKTLLVKMLAQALELDFNRIQFTPDLMPSDILGTELLNDSQDQLRFEYQQGPIFTNLLLADEINRTPPKTQSALLEAMEERCVTVAGQTRRLPNPFQVVATQNPIEQEGTYPLPEAQLDRFMFSLKVAYPSKKEESEIVRRTTYDTPAEVSPVLSGDRILSVQELVRAIPVTDHVIDYAVELVNATRPDDEKAPQVTKNYIEWGAGPRASQNLVLGAKALALLKGKPAPETDDVRAIFQSVLDHRIIMNYRATGEGVSSQEVLTEIVRVVKEKAY